MALRLYRRHTKACPHTEYNYRRCNCPVWVRGTLNNTKIQMSLDQTDWDAGGRIISGWTKAGEIGQTFDTTANTVAETIDAFMLDCDARGLARDTKKKYRNLLGYVAKDGTIKGRLLTWCRANGVPVMRDLTLDRITRFRATWADAPLTKSKTQERLSWFFGWCVKRDILKTNPAEGLSPVKLVPNPTLPFTNNEHVAILNACDSYWTGNNRGYDNRARVKAFVLLLRWTGLRIRDVATIEWSRIGDGRVFLYTQKTGQPVNVPVPAHVIAAVQAVPRSGRYVFWTGNGDVESVTSNWQRALRKVFRKAGIHNGHAHRFRDTFAVELLLAGVDLPDVAVLLGHSSVRTTEKHYAPWVHARQARLETAVQRTFADVPPVVPPTKPKRGSRSTRGSAKRPQL